MLFRSLLVRASRRSAVDRRGEARRAGEQEDENVDGETCRGDEEEARKPAFIEKNGVKTNDYGTYKVTTKITDAKSDCRHQRDGNGVTVTLAYRWTHEQSVAGRGMQIKATSRTVLKLPEAAVLHPPKQLTGRIEQIKTVDAPSPTGGSHKIDKNVTGMLELLLKNEQITPELFETSQAVKSLPIVIEQVSAGSAK